MKKFLSAIAVAALLAFAYSQPSLPVKAQGVSGGGPQPGSLWGLVNYHIGVSTNTPFVTTTAPTLLSTATNDGLSRLGMSIAVTSGPSEVIWTSVPSNTAQGFYPVSGGINTNGTLYMAIGIVTNGGKWETKFPYVDQSPIYGSTLTNGGNANWPVVDEARGIAR